MYQYSDLSNRLFTTEKPAELPNAQQLQEAEEKLSVQLPSDYKWFVQAYGTGAVADYMRVLNPATNLQTSNLIWAALDDDFDAYRSCRDVDPTTYVYARYPESEGLLPCAHTIDGDIVYWKTEGLADAWTLISFDRGLQKFHPIELVFCEFLEKLITTTEFSHLYADNVPFCDGQFFVYSY